MIGLGGIASDTVERYPARPGLDTNSLSAALGAGLQLVPEWLALGLGHAGLGETAFGVSPVGAASGSTALYRLIVTEAHLAPKMRARRTDSMPGWPVTSAAPAGGDSTSGLVVPFGTEQQFTGGLTIETEAGRPLRVVGEILAQGLHYGGDDPQSGIDNSTRLARLAGVATGQIALWTFHGLVRLARWVGNDPGRHCPPNVEMAVGGRPIRYPPSGST